MNYVLLLVNYMCTNRIKKIKAVLGTVRYTLTSVELRSRLEIESISEVMRTSRLHCFGSVERKDEEDEVKCLKHFEVEGKVPV